MEPAASLLLLRRNLRLPICASCLRTLRLNICKPSVLNQNQQLRRQKHSRAQIARPGEQAISLSGYYAEILDSAAARAHSGGSAKPNVPPPPRAAAAQPATAGPRSPPAPSSTGSDDVRARAKIVFGSRLAGPAERRAETERRAMNVAGVMVPPRPEEPDNCCMSGCVNCVWDTYRDELEEWAARAAEARRRLLAQGKGGSRDEQRLRGFRAGGTSGKGIPTGPGSMDEDGGGSETNWYPAGVDLNVAGKSGADLFADIPVGIREFMRTEKMLKEKRAEAARA